MNREEKKKHRNQIIKQEATERERRQPWKGGSDSEELGQGEAGEDGGDLVKSTEREEKI
jgi:hypothetical protein